MQTFAYSSQGKSVFADEALKNTDYSCPGCGKTVRLKKGLHRQKHFFHLSTKDCHFSKKSPHHLQTQLHLARLHNGKLEERFPLINRIADVYCLDQKIIYEVQCSPISPEEVLSRNRDYAKLGLSVHWIFHDRRKNRAAKAVLSTYSLTNIDRYGHGSIRPHTRSSELRPYQKLFHTLLQLFSS